MEEELEIVGHALSKLIIFKPLLRFLIRYISLIMFPLLVSESRDSQVAGIGGIRLAARAIEERVGGDGDGLLYGLGVLKVLLLWLTFDDEYLCLEHIIVRELCFVIAHI